MLLLALLDVFVENIPEIFPSGFRDQNAVAKVALDLGHGDVSALSVLFAGEVKVLVLDTDVAIVRSVGSLVDFAVVVFLDQLLQMMIELFHSVGRDENLEAGISAGESLRDFQKSATRIFLI